MSGRIEVTVGSERRILGPGMLIISQASCRTGFAVSVRSPAKLSAPVPRQVSNHLLSQIILRKFGSRFFWKCSISARPTSV